MKPSLLAFVQAFIQSGASDRLESAMQFYAPKVDYYDKGTVDVDFIRNDISEFWRRWSRREYQLFDTPVARTRAWTQSISGHLSGSVRAERSPGRDARNFQCHRSGPG